MTHSEYVMQSLTQNIWKWEEKGYKTSRGKKVVNLELFRLIQALILDLEKSRVNVEFWKAERRENEDAVGLAGKLFDEEGYQHHDENVKGVGNGKEGNNEHDEDEKEEHWDRENEDGAQPLLPPAIPSPTFFPLIPSTPKRKTQAFSKRSSHLLALHRSAVSPSHRALRPRQHHHAHPAHL
jgi:hypothetical protein